MKRILIFLIVFVLALFLTGCAPTVPSDKDVVVEITGFEQEVSLGAKSLIMFNGEDYKYKCDPPPCASCCPECPGCNSCCEECEECQECEQCEECQECEQCEECQECEQCEECQECEQCEECQECPDIPECPSCPSCPCPIIKWGDILVNYKMSNVGNVDLTVDRVCFIITFDDGTEIERCVDMEVTLLVGENIEKQVGIILPLPVKRVIFVEIKSYELF